MENTQTVDNEFFYFVGKIMYENYKLKTENTLLKEENKDLTESDNHAWENVKELRNKVAQYE